MNYDLDGRGAIIRGAAHGIGYAISNQDDPSNAESTERHQLTRPYYVTTDGDHRRASSVYACVRY
jgi:hypothetical protein